MILDTLYASGGGSEEDYQHGVDTLLINGDAATEEEAIRMCLADGTLPVALGEAWLRRIERRRAVAAAELLRDELVEQARAAAGRAGEVV